MALLWPSLCWTGPGPGGAEWRSREHRRLSPAPALPAPRELDGWVFVELDVGSEGNADGAQIQDVLHSVISRGSIDSYVTSPQGFQFRRLGTGEPILGLGVTCSGSLDWSRSLLVSPRGAFLAWACPPRGTESSPPPAPAPWALGGVSQRSTRSQRARQTRFLLFHAHRRPPTTPRRPAFSRKPRWLPEHRGQAGRSAEGLAPSCLAVL